MNRKSNTRCPCGCYKFGYLINGNTLRKNVQGSKHQVRKPPAWSIQKECFDYHESGLKSIEILDTEVDMIYTVEKDVFVSKRFSQNRWFGSQYFLTLEHWIMTSNRLVAPEPGTVKFPGAPAWAKTFWEENEKQQN